MAGSVFTIIRLVLSLVSMFARKMHDDGKIDEGMQRQLFKDLKNISRSAGIAKEIEEEINNMTPEEINRELEGDFFD